MIKNFKLLLLASLVSVACSQDEVDISGIAPEEPPVTAGSADFSKYVALGNSLTAGFSDGALFIKGQENSYAKLLADQFALAGGGEFKIPFMSDNVGGFSNLNPMTGALIFEQRLYFDGCAPTRLAGTPSTNFGVSVGSQGPFNNLGVPGAKSFHLIASGYGNIANFPAAANPYFIRMASSPTTSVLADAMSQNPTFFSLWIGNNDVLGYALSGGDGSDPITPEATFNFAYTTLVDALTTNGAKGVVANIPYVTTIPQFTTIPIKPVAPYTFFEDAGEDDCSETYPVSDADRNVIDLLNSQLYGPLKSILTALGHGDRIELISSTSNNPILISDESLEDLGPQITLIAQNSGNPLLTALAPYLGVTYAKARQTKQGDLIPLTTRGVIGTDAPVPPGIPNDLAKFGISYPLLDKHILVPSEILEIRNATDLYNAKIKEIAETKNLAFVDANAILTQLSTTGIRFDNFHMTNSFVTGGAFSLDGIHITARGNAYIANKFAEAINAKYGSTLRMNKMKDFQIHYPPVLN